MSINITYKFSAPVWKHSANGGWYFVSLPIEFSKEIRQNMKWQEEGWGRMKTKSKIRETSWDTAIWYDTKLGTYILPLKVDSRKKEKIEIGNILDVEIIL
ncbi:MAG: hypothetical protein RL432_274 [Bacteroidota bacterium]